MKESVTRSAARLLSEQPWRTFTVIGLLTASGIAEGIGVLVLLPGLELASGARPSTTGNLIRAALRSLSLPPTIYAFAAAIVVALLVKALLRWAAMTYTARTVTNVSAELRRKLIHALMNADWSHFVSQPGGALASAVSRDALWGAFSYRNACAAFSAIAQALVYAVGIFAISWKLGLMATGVAALATLPLAGWISRSKRAGEKQTRGATALSTHLLDTIHAMKPIKAMARSQAFEQILFDDVDALRAGEQEQVSAVETLRSFQEPALAILLIIVVVAAVTWAHASIPAVMVVAVLLQRIVSRLHAAQGEYQNTAVALTALESVDTRIADASSSKELTGGTADAPFVESFLEVEDLHFSHAGRAILRGVNVRIEPGEFVAIVGDSAAGKTTLLDIIAGLRIPDSGTVLIDGVPLSTIARESWGRVIGYMPQESALMHSSISDNVRLGSTNDASLQDVLSLTGLNESQYVGEHGLGLSGGERRRIALARALLAQPRLLLLDEPTSELDEAAALEIAKALRALRGRMTIIAVTHHPAVMQTADVVYTLADGRLETAVPRSGSTP